MLDDIVIRAEGLGKKYLIGHQIERERYTALRDAVARGTKRLWRNALDMARGRAIVGGDITEQFWALKDITFEVKRGEVLGIIGRNGAGKSTLLKILSRITEPSEGRVSIRGRVASLLEIGTGFHPELTGRENIFLNGAILGMSHREIRRKFDEIVSFADIQRFLDTPVKRYSSGMYVRLAFAIAAHLEPEILIVDEVLAVGDAEFQRKCLGRMGTVAREGRTVILVSHNLGSLLSICDSGLLLENGTLIEQNNINAVLRAYQTKIYGTKKRRRVSSTGPLQTLQINDLYLNGEPLAGMASAISDKEIVIALSGAAQEAVPDFRFAMALFKNGVRIVTFHDGPTLLPSGCFQIQLSIPARLLRPGEYSIAAGGRRVSGDEWIWATDLGWIEIIPKWDRHYESDNEGVVNLPCKLHRVAVGQPINFSVEDTETLGLQH